MSRAEPVTESLSHLIARRLAETRGAEQARALTNSDLMRGFLEVLDQFAVRRSEGPISEVFHGRSARESRAHEAAVDVFLVTHPDSDHQALVLEVDAFVSRLSELSEFLQSADRAHLTQLKRFNDAYEAAHNAFRRRTPLKGSLNPLKNVAELGPIDEAYQRADFSKSNLRPSGLLRK